MKKPDTSEIVGAIFYLLVFVVQFSRQGSLSDDLLLLTIPAMVIACLVLTFREGVLPRTGLGLAIASSGGLWQLATLQARPKFGDDILIFTGLFALAGGMLLAKSRSLSTGPAMAVGWGAVGLLWLSTQTPYGLYLPPLLGLSLLALRFKKRL